MGRLIALFTSAATTMNRPLNPDDTPAQSSSPALSRNELLAALVLFLIGVAVRVAFPSAMAVEHFDEGVYASNLWCPGSGFQYPDRHLYAPALLPALIEWSLMLFGSTPWAPMVPSLVFGSLTVPLIWWVGRSWFGPAAGLSAAALAALSDYHILFSRSALTDVTLGFWLLLAVYFFESAFRTLNPARAVIAGVVTGLAWWTKYNGWLPLAISLSGLLAWSVFASREERQLGRRLILWGIAAVTALVVWSPFWWSLPQGYSQVAANHRQYVVGFAGWRDGILRQSQTQFYVVRGLTGVAVIVALIVALFLTPSRSRAWIDKWKSLPPAPPSLSLALPLRLHQTEWLLLAWFASMTLATPLYRPYPRLALPWFISGCLGIVWLFLGTARFENVRIPRWLSVPGTVLLLIVLVCLEFIEVPRSREARWIAGWQSRTALADIAPQVQEVVRRVVSEAGSHDVGGRRAVLYVFAEPGLFFHLPADDLAVAPAGSLDFLKPDAPSTGLPTFLATGPHAHRSAAFEEQVAQHAERIELVQRWPYAASDFVLLDQVPPSQLEVERAKCEIRLYRVK